MPMPCTSLKISSRLKHQASPDTNTRLPGRVLSCHLPSGTDLIKVRRANVGDVDSITVGQFSHKGGRERGG